MMRFELGKKAKDKVTGFEGTMTGYAHYLYGCDQYLLVAKSEKRKMADAQWFDDGRIEVIGKGITADKVKGTSNGPEFRSDSPHK